MASLLGSGPCGRCINCRYMVPTSKLINRTNGNEFGIIDNIDCRQQNVIYVIQCKTCPWQHTAYTTRTLRQVINDKRSGSAGPRKPLDHFYLEGHNGLSDLEVIGIQKFPANMPTEDIKCLEKIWKQEFLNDDWDIKKYEANLEEDRVENQYYEAVGDGATLPEVRHVTDRYVVPEVIDVYPTEPEVINLDPAEPEVIDDELVVPEVIVDYHALKMHEPDRDCTIDKMANQMANLFNNPNHQRNAESIYPSSSQLTPPSSTRSMALPLLLLTPPPSPLRPMSLPPSKQTIPSMSDSARNGEPVEKTQRTQSGLSAKCGRPDCVCCSYMKYSNTVKSTITGKEYSIPGNYNCETINVVYLIECRMCGKQYVGETGQKISKRISQHRSLIKNSPSKNTVTKHFSSNGHSVDDVQVMCIEAITLRPNEDYRYNKRICREKFWQAELRTIGKDGLNKEIIGNGQSDEDSEEDMDTDDLGLAARLNIEITPVQCLFSGTGLICRHHICRQKFMNSQSYK